MVLACIDIIGPDQLAMSSRQSAYDALTSHDDMFAEGKKNDTGNKADG